MNTAIFIYLAEVIQSIGVLLTFGGLFGCGGYVLFTAIFWVNEDKYHGHTWALIVPAALLVLAALIPSSKTMYLMAGAYLGEKAVESEMGQQVMEVLKIKLSEELQKIKGEKK